MNSQTDADYRPVLAAEFNAVVDKVNVLSSSDGALIADTISELTSGSGVTGNLTASGLIAITYTIVV